MKTNVVALEVRRRPVEVEACRVLPSQEVFASQQRDLAEVPDTFHKGYTIVKGSTANRSLRLADREDFLGMCLPLLWGDEKTAHLERFGYLLRGAVETFKPQTTFELAMLKNIVGAQWNLDRLYITQSNVYESESQRGEIGRFGLPKAGQDAREFNGEVAKAQKQLNIAIATYRQMVKVAFATERERQL